MNNNTNFRRFFGAMLTILGTLVILFACVAFLSNGKPVLGLEVTGWKALAPFVVGFIFFTAGISLVRES